MDILIGRITHYYDKIGVAVVSVMNQTLRVGDVVKISGRESEYSQTVRSLQVEHTKVMSVEPNEECGLPVDMPVNAGDVLYLLTRHE